MSIRSHIPVSNNELILGFLLCFLAGFLVAESRWSRLHNPFAVNSEEPVHLYLNEQTDLATLQQTLVDSGLVKNKEELQWAANLLGWRSFNKGHYLVDRGYTYEQFLSKLARGIQDPVSVTILPGKSKAQIAESVSGSLQFDSLAFQKVLRDSSLLAEHQLEEKDVIGRLYPNTYSMFWTTPPEKVFERILKEFDKSVVKKFRNRLEEINRSVDEVITLASIVEWEAKSQEEQSIISGLYWNRLDRGMRLQADPTVNFAVGERRRLLYEDYRIDHPYNTYQYRGLPPGPITNPSLSAIRATLYPTQHDYLYMVASPNGEHAFSETFEEHKRKSAKWREWLQKQYRIKRQREQGNSQ